MEKTNERPPVAWFAKKFRYNPETGEVFGKYRKPLTSTINGRPIAGYSYDGTLRNISRAVLAFALMTGKFPDRHIMRKNGDPLDLRWQNLAEADHSQYMTGSRSRKTLGIHRHGNGWRVTTGGGRGETFDNALDAKKYRAAVVFCKRNGRPLPNRKPRLAKKTAVSAA